MKISKRTYYGRKKNAKQRVKFVRQSRSMFSPGTSSEILPNVDMGNESQRLSDTLVPEDLTNRNELVEYIDDTNSLDMLDISSTSEKNDLTNSSYTDRDPFRTKQKNYNARLRLNFNAVSRKPHVKNLGNNADQDYGSTEDMPENVCLQKQEEFLKSLEIDETQRSELEIITRGQNSNPLWKQERAIRITASVFGKICKLQKKTSCVKTVELLLYKDFFGNAATRYGNEHEPIALSKFSHISGLEVQGCGLYIHRDYPFLGASPDGLVGEYGILEIKCPWSASKLTIQEAIEQKKIKFLNLNADGDINLKPEDLYMYQVQGQMEVCNKEYCYFVVWTPLDTKILKINRDNSFWEEKMKDKLIHFYKLCILPEIIDPRLPRNLPIRNPDRPA